MSGSSSSRKTVSHGVPPPAAGTLQGSRAGAHVHSSRASVLPTAAKSTPGAVPPTRLVRSEDLLAWMKACGYNPPKHLLKPEQYDYLFQDKDTLALVQMLGRQITNRNVLDKVEVDAMEKLVDENRAVYGKELEQLVDRSRKERQSKIDRALERDQELQELKRRIQEKKESIEKLKEIEAKFIADKEAQAGEASLISYQAQLIEKDCETIRNELQEDEGQQGGREVHLECLTMINKKSQELEIPTTFINQITSQSLQLEEAVRDRMKVKVDLESDLMKQSLTPFQISKRFEQYGKDLERLKHCIIYECIQWVQNQCQKTVGKALQEKMPNFKKENERAQQLTEEVRSKMMMEKRDSIDNLKKSVQLIMDKKLKQLRLNLLQKFRKDTQEIQLQKYESRKQIQSHFQIFYDILMDQFSQAMFCEGLIDLKNEKTLEFFNSLKNFCEPAEELRMERQYLISPIVEANLSPENQAIAKLFTSHGISHEVLRSPEATKYAFSMVQLRLKQASEKEEQEKEKGVSQRIKNMCQESRNFSKQWGVNQKIRDQWDSDWRNVGILENKLEKIEMDTKSHFMTKDKEIKEALKENEGLLAEMKEFLQAYNARVEAAAKAEQEASGTQIQNRRRSSMAGISSQTFDFSFASTSSAASIS